MRGTVAAMGAAALLLLQAAATVRAAPEMPLCDAPWPPPARCYQHASPRTCVADAACGWCFTYGQCMPTTPDGQVDERAPLGCPPSTAGSFSVGFACGGNDALSCSECLAKNGGGGGSGGGGGGDSPRCGWCPYTGTCVAVDAADGLPIGGASMCPDDPFGGQVFSTRACCGERYSCGDCVAVDGCGWCPRFGRCIAADADGRPALGSSSCQPDASLGVFSASQCCAAYPPSQPFRCTGEHCPSACVSCTSANANTCGYCPRTRACFVPDGSGAPPDGVLCAADAHFGNYTESAASCWQQRADEPFERPGGDGNSGGGDGDGGGVATPSSAAAAAPAPAAAPGSALATAAAPAAAAPAPAAATPSGDDGPSPPTLLRSVALCVYDAMAERLGSDELYGNGAGAITFDYDFGYLSPGSAPPPELGFIDAKGNHTYYVGLYNFVETARRTYREKRGAGYFNPLFFSRSYDMFLNHVSVYNKTELRLFRELRTDRSLHRLSRDRQRVLAGWGEALRADGCANDTVVEPERCPNVGPLEEWSAACTQRCCLDERATAAALARVNARHDALLRDTTLAAKAKARATFDEHGEAARYWSRSTGWDARPEWDVAQLPHEWLAAAGRGEHASLELELDAAACGIDTTGGGGGDAHVHSLRVTLSVGNVSVVAIEPGAWLDWHFVHRFRDGPFLHNEQTRRLFFGDGPRTDGGLIGDVPTGVLLASQLYYTMQLRATLADGSAYTRSFNTSSSHAHPRVIGYTFARTLDRAAAKVAADEAAQTTTTTAAAATATTTSKALPARTSTAGGADGDATTATTPAAGGATTTTRAATATTTTTAAATKTDERHAREPSAGNNDNAGAIAGGLIGAVCAALLIGAAVVGVMWLRRRRRDRLDGYRRLLQLDDVADEPF